MRILVVCDQGNNRSVTLAHQLKYFGHDVLTAGQVTNEHSTLRMLYEWAERIITVDAPTTHAVPVAYKDKVQLWEIGPDVYRRPFNRDLYNKIRRLVEQHRKEYA